VTDEILVEISRRAPKKTENLSAIRSLTERAVQQHGAQILEAVARGLAVSPDDRPEPPPLRSEDPARARVVDLMDLLVQIRSRETGIGRNVMATRLDLDRFLAGHLGQDDDGEPPRIAHGWRFELVGGDLVRLLEGNIDLGIDPKEMVPRVTRHT
jgi:ribonuclease D